MPILSQNKFKYFRSLKLKKFRQSEGKFIIEGIKLCHEAISAKVKINAFLFYPQNVSSKIINDFILLCEEKDIPYYDISGDMLQSLSDTVHSQGVICIIENIEHQLNFQHLSFLLALDAVSDPGNLGTIIRTADWFGLDAILLGENSVELYNPKVIRSTMGSIFHLPVLSNIKLDNLLYQLKELGFTVYAADVHGKHFYNTIKFANRKVLIIGNETTGISFNIAQLCDVKLKIPSHGKAESLNMAVATGIILSQMVNYCG